MAGPEDIQVINSEIVSTSISYKPVTGAKERLVVLPLLTQESRNTHVLRCDGCLVRARRRLHGLV